MADSEDVTDNPTPMPLTLVNHNKIPPRLECMPTEVITLIIDNFSEEEKPATLYLLRQVCHSIAHVISMTDFSEFHEPDESKILNRMGHGVMLQELPLVPFDLGLVGVAFSKRSQMVRRLILQDRYAAWEQQEGEEVATWEQQEGEEEGEEESEEEGEEEEGEEVATWEDLSFWEGKVAICPHCPLTGQDIREEHGESWDTPDVTIGFDSRDEEETIFRCNECWQEFVPAGVDVSDRFPKVEQPHLAYLTFCELDPTGQESCITQHLSVSWTMPIFPDPLGEGPKTYTKLDLERRLKELAEGPYRHLLDRGAKLAKFTDPMFLRTWEQHQAGWASRIPEQGSAGLSDSDVLNDINELCWITHKGDLYLQLHYNYIHSVVHYFTGVHELLGL